MHLTFNQGVVGPSHTRSTEVFLWKYGRMVRWHTANVQNQHGFGGSSPSASALFFHAEEISRPHGVVEKLRVCERVRISPSVDIKQIKMRCRR